MANAGNAYATVNPIKTNIGDVIQGIEGMDFAYREEQRKIDEIKQKEKEAKQKKLDDFIASIPNAKPTGVKTVDEYIMGGMITFPDDVLSNYKEIQELEQKENRSPAEQERYMKAKIKAENLKKYPENLQNFVSGYLENIKTYQKGLDEGVYLPDPNIEKIKADGLKGIVPGRDENGMPTAGFFDENNDGIIDVLNFDDINKKLVINPTPKKDAFSVVSELAKTLKADTNKETKGYWTIENKLVNEDELKSTIRGLIDKNVLATEAFKRGLPIDYQWKPEEITALEEELYKSAKSFIEEKTEKTKNYQDENADLTRQQNANQFNKKQKLEEEKLKLQNEKIKTAREKEGVTEPISVQEISKAGFVDATNNGTYKGAKKGSIVYTLPKGGIRRIRTEGVEELITDILIDPKTNEVVISGTKYTTNSDKTKTEIPFNRSTNSRAEEVNSFAQLMNNENGEPYKDYKELREDLLKKNNTDDFDWSTQ